jgi:hypothetical protein
MRNSWEIRSGNSPSYLHVNVRIHFYEYRVCAGRHHTCDQESRIDQSSRFHPPCFLRFQNRFRRRSQSSNLSTAQRRSFEIWSLVVFRIDSRSLFQTSQSFTNVMNKEEQRQHASIWELYLRVRALGFIGTGEGFNSRRPFSLLAACTAWVAGSHPPYFIPARHRPPIISTRRHRPHRRQPEEARHP